MNIDVGSKFYWKEFIHDLLLLNLKGGTRKEILDSFYQEFLSDHNAETETLLKLCQELPEIT